MLVAMQLGSTLEIILFLAFIFFVYIIYAMILLENIFVHMHK